MSSTGASDVQMSDCAGTIVKVRGSLQSEEAGDRSKEHEKLQKEKVHSDRASPECLFSYEPCHTASGCTARRSTSGN